MIWIYTFSGCKIKVEDGNEDDLSDICANGMLLGMEPSTSHSVTVNCEV